MRIPGIKTAKNYARWLQGRWVGGAMILGYHRIAQSENDAYSLNITPTHFAEHLEILRKHTHPLSLPRLVDHLKQGILPRKTVAVTFDDGYSDNLHTSKPLLERYQIPATVFVSSGFLGEEFWWDELERLLMDAPEIPSGFQLRIQGDVLEWNQMRMDSDLENRDSEVDRKQLLQSIYTRLLPLETEKLQEKMNEIKDWLGNHPRQKMVTHSALTIPELKELVEGELVEIGAHSKTHAILPDLTIEKQKEEIYQSKIYLEELCGKPISGFAYPHGKFLHQTQAIVREAGFMFACSSRPELVWRSQQCYALPRIWPRDWDGDQFAKVLRFWLGG